jgi:hypothetical protein
MKPPNPSPLISPATMAWIVNNAAAHLPLVETAPDDEVLDRCGGCQGTHEEGDADDTIDWWMCSKCGQWYAVECLGLGQEQVQAIRADNNTKWACEPAEGLRLCALPCGGRAPKRTGPWWSREASAQLNII